MSEVPCCTQEDFNVCVYHCNCKLRDTHVVVTLKVSAHLADTFCFDITSGGDYSVTHSVTNTGHTPEYSDPLQLFFIPHTIDYIRLIIINIINKIRNGKDSSAERLWQLLKKRHTLLFYRATDSLDL